MNKILSWMLTALLCGDACGQDLSMTFTGFGATDRIDSIEIINISSGRTLTLPGTSTLILGNRLGVQAERLRPPACRLYPNPCHGRSNLVLNTSQDLEVTIAIIRSDGIRIAGYHGLAVAGEHRFTLVPGLLGTCLVNLNAGGLQKGLRLVNLSVGDGPAGIKPVSFKIDDGKGLSEPVAGLKNGQTSFVLGYTSGDTLLYRCHSGDYATTFTDCPVNSGDYRVEFADCTDEEGRLYPVVKIGSALWMAENLAFLPKVNEAGESSDQLPLLYVYGNAETQPESARQSPNYQEYGVLYNWPAAVIACPPGWRLPSTADWNWLAGFQDAVLKRGFGAQTGGRVQADAFAGLGHSAGFWSSTETGTLNAESILLDFDSASVNSLAGPKRDAWSVRCIRMEGAAGGGPTVNTYAPDGITTTTLEAHGNVIANGSGQTVTARGFCWSAEPEPTLGGQSVEAGQGYGAFSARISGLTPGVTFFVRAYATNDSGTVYGLPLKCSTRQGGIFLDARDSHSYRFTLIGDQYWMEENLAWLPSVNPPGEISSLASRYYVYGYEGRTTDEAESAPNYGTYGVLYNWPAAQSACPDGWHLPTRTEWEVLIRYLGGDPVAGNKLKSTSGWNPNGTENGNGDNSSGFTALPGGDLEGAGLFLNLGNYGSFWTTGADQQDNGWMWLLDNFNVGAFLHSYPKSIGVSVRCIRDRME